MTPPTKSKFVQLFERDMGRCVYCGMDLTADYDRFMMATEDHLVPASIGGKSRNLENLKSIGSDSIDPADFRGAVPLNSKKLVSGPNSHGPC